MKRLGMIVAWCWMAGMAVAADGAGLIANGDFAKLDAAGKAVQWEVRVRGENKFSFTPAEGGMVLLLNCVNDKQPALLIHRNLPLASDKRYQVSYEVKGGTGARYLAYCEWQFQPAGVDKPVIKGAETRIKSASENWTKQQFTFTFPKECTSPYFVFGSRNGEVCFRNLALTEVK